MSDSPSPAESPTAQVSATTGAPAGQAAHGARPAPTLSSLKIDRNPAPRRRRRRWWPWAAAALAVGVGAFVLLSPRKAEVQITSVVVAYPSQALAELTASGYVVAQRRAAVSSKGTGRLIDLRVREGSVVKAGELIARLDAADVQAGIAAGQVAVVQAEAARTQAEASLGQARAELDNAVVELRRQKDLAAQGFVSSQAVDAADRRAAVARSALATQQAAVATAQAAVAQSRAQLNVQQVNQANTEIRAPFDGVVLVKNANVGDMITPFSSATGTSGAVVTMADMGTLEVEADVSESNVGLVRIDQPVEVVLDALPDVRLRGRVVRIVPTVDRAKATVMTKVRFDQPDARVLPEMSAKVSFLSAAPGPDDGRPVTAVHPKTVVERDGRKVVFRIKGDTVDAIPVTPGRTLGDALEITGGTLAPGDRLVLAPDAKLAAGQAVAVTGK